MVAWRIRRFDLGFAIIYIFFFVKETVNVDKSYIIYNWKFAIDVCN